MAEDESPKSQPEIAPPAPGPLPSREPRPDPVVIEGEATEIHGPAPHEPAAAEAAAPEQAAHEPGAEEPAAHEPAAATELSPETPRRGVAWPFLAALLGAAAGAAIALGLGWFLDPRAGEIETANSRLATLQRDAEAGTAAGAALDKRVRALEASEADAAKATALDELGRRVKALESAAGKNETAQSALEEAAAARADAAKALALAGAAGAGQSASPAPAPFDASALEARIGKLESAVAALKPVPDLAPIDDRLAKLEAALAAPKSEARVAPSEAAPAGGAAAAILAISLVERLDAGAPYAQELAALTRLAADPAKLAALKPFAEAGAPTVASLRAAFVKAAPAVVAAAAPPSEGGVLDRLVDHMRKLVTVHKVGEAAGDDPEALTSRISAALARGDLAAALEAFGRLPEAARQAAGDWAKGAQARQAAGAAALALREEAIGRLATAKD